jgi:hypothetical protein
MDLLLAIRRDGALQEVRLEKRSHETVTTAFEDLGSAFLKDGTEILPYSAGYKPDAGELMELKYDLPKQLWDCRAALDSSVLKLDAVSLKTNPPVALVAITCGRRPIFRFQAMDNRQLLHTKHVLLMGAGSFHLNANPGLIIGDRIDALHEDGKLYFRSEHTVRRFLDLEKFFLEATDEQVEAVLGVRPFVIENLDGVKAAAKTLVRRKIAELAEAAPKFKLPMLKFAASKAKIRLTERNGGIVVPSTARELEKLVRLLHDDYLESLFGSGRVYRTNSKLLV